jgi:hypothetical protein
LPALRYYLSLGSLRKHIKTSFRNSGLRAANLARDLPNTTLTFSHHAVWQTAYHKFHKKLTAMNSILTCFDMFSCFYRLRKRLSSGYSVRDVKLCQWPRILHSPGIELVQLYRGLVASDLRGGEKASNVRHMSRVNDDGDDNDDNILYRESDLNKADRW